ncbi:ABC transporter ATP-binding protein [Actinosynnema sp. NPDC023587]|uniref:ABC transporter ATP-binding protein n=1 Tax=Actinosynnema sp. NPDC023587 TaxID=3154695 RepID=UPI0033EB2CA5
MTASTAPPPAAPEQADRGGFVRALARLGVAFAPLYVCTLLVWTVVHGLPLVVGYAIGALLDRAVAAPTDAGTWGLLALAVGAMAARALVLLPGLALDFTLIFRVSARLKERAVAATTGRSSARGPRLSGGDVLNRVRDDSDEVAEFLGWSADFVYRTVLLVIALVVLLRTDWVTTLALAPMVGGLAVAGLLKRRVGALADDTRARQGHIAGRITDVLTGIRDLRLGGRVDWHVEELSHSFGLRRGVQARHQMYTDLLSGLFRNIVMFGTAIVLVVVSTRLVGGGFTIGDLALFLTYVGWLSEQIFFFGRAVARHQNAKVSHERIGELWRGFRADRPVPAGPPLTELTVTGLARRGGDGPGSEPVAFTGRPGDVVLLTGPIGTGKSTLLRGLIGLDPAVAGSVRWNGREVLGDADWWRSPRVGFARQGAGFVDGTVRDNLVLGDPAVDEAVMARALAAVDLAPGSPELPDGLDTPVGAGGAQQLSGGQRQRLALARMLCRPAEVYVVDDCDSSLDAATARALWRTLPVRWPGLWVVVSHNEDLAAVADRVITVRKAGA